MNNVLALQCSPHAGGVSDAVVSLFTEGMAEAGITPRIAALRDYAFSPCTGCGACSRPPHACVLAGRPLPEARGEEAQTDQAEELFTLIAEAQLLMLSSPIYFYFLPAHFKALIDRTQRFWSLQAAAGNAPMPLSKTRPTLVALTAGRPRGKQLFAGSLLSLKYFLAPLGAGIRETRLLRGLETLKDLRERPAVTAALHAWGHDWGRRLIAQEEVFDLPRALPPNDAGA